MKKNARNGAETVKIKGQEIRAMAKRKKKDEDIEAYRHEAETRKNAVPVGLASLKVVS